MSDKVIYMIGSLRDTRALEVAKELRLKIPNYEFFTDWASPGPNADDFWKRYELDKGNDYLGALKSYAATHVFEFDKYHLDRADASILVMKCGKSAHLELGFTLGRFKPGFILLEKPTQNARTEEERWDVMYQFADGVFYEVEDLVLALKDLDTLIERKHKELEKYFETKIIQRNQKGS